MTASHLNKLMKNGGAYQIHPCIDASLNFTSELWRAQIKQAMKTMSTQSLWHRFATGINELSDEQLDYLTDIDGKDRVAWCAVIYQDNELRGIGVSRYIKLDVETDTAEFAVTVIDEFQGQGVGRALFDQLIDSAKDNGIRCLRGYILPGNQAMLALCKQKQAKIQPEDKMLRVEIPLTSSS